MPTDYRKEFAFWLLPSDSFKIKLRSIIDKLASENFGPGFEPHLTLHAGPSNDREAQTIVNRIAREFSVVDLNAETLDQSSQFTKTLFVKFDCPAVLKEMNAVVIEGLAQFSKYDFSPHVSLLYSPIQEEDRKKIVATLKWPKGKYTFDKVAAIEFVSPIEGPEQVNGWRKVSEAKLLQTLL